MSITVLGIVAGVVAVVYAMGKLSDAVEALIRSWIPVVLAFQELRRAARRGTAGHAPVESGESAVTRETSGGRP
ncbi:hypothetical protein ACFQ60_17305 [Streptomyces zhihengii]|uniref:Secreted protein n=1 Tax=Streptomyces zhihengii TaxID=1818004 RepID=A0ABS2UWE2_9ACTN|nr:hypothetical protein [Streptomyces zhihengii]MBM9621886.1 hypothetical protein [Streptomyces zhihengii]